MAGRCLLLCLRGYGRIIGFCQIASGDFHAYLAHAMEDAPGRGRKTIAGGFILGAMQSLLSKTW
ncbi:hypothetical protein D8I35_10510 [Corticibacter populi]|uniref:Uncharacterized protein n=1 Tax=Corticibacter populi TaxID=1550736 RepID=A0A3M6QRF2_9BURK|nr:hypothetical protein D8I35_10510 [Corticibacter populi]